MRILARQIVRVMIAALALCSLSPVQAQPASPPEEIRFEEEAIVEVTINGVPARLEVQPGLAGPPILNRAIIRQLVLPNPSERSIDFGSRLLPGYLAKAVIDFGYGEEQTKVAWSPLEASSKADGVIGVHDLPYRLVTFQLAETSASETLQRFKLKRRRGNNFTRLGTQIKVARKKLFLIFALHLEPNVVTASTANFLATHLDGGFVADSDASVDLVFGVRVPTRDMRLVYPIEFGALNLDRFAVRVLDHGRPDMVGEIDADDPRFTEDGSILVSRRKPTGKPDLLTRVGRSQIAHCSRLTFDLEEMEGQLSCDAGKLAQR